MRVPIRSAGTRSGVNWMRLKLPCIALGQGRYRQGLGQARHAFDQKMAAGQQRHQHPLQEMILADHDLLHFVKKMLQPLMRAAPLPNPSLQDYNGFSPTALAAFSIGTAKAMPAKTRCPVGLKMRGHDAHHFAIAVDQRSARIAGIHRRIELDQVPQMAAIVLAVGIDEFALQARDHAGRDRRPDAERKAHRHHRVARD